MSANFVYLVILVIFAICFVAINTACVKWSLKWTNVADTSLLRSLGLAVVFTLIGTLITAGAAFAFSAASDGVSTLAEPLVNIAAALLAPAILIALIYKARFTKALLASLLYLVMSVTASLALAYAVRTFAYEAFLIPTNSMAPTVLGNHWQAPCPRCGAPAYGTPIDSRSFWPPDGVQLVCSKELQSVYVDQIPQVRGGGDRILACKLLSPKRWDMIVFRLPSDPAISYVKRLVGLPGESLEIRDGAVWINGEKVDPPDSIRGIPYSPTVEANGRQFSGPGSDPVTLGPDEYFVLGDFVDGAADSRLWEQGAPGHPPYAVPKENIVGVVINIYWPPSRWTSFR